ncbi:MAG: hypothetical protein IJ087_18950, partial [Eggerthellaceae bacterium]|nr:hypothetical protein [Eggerthellaceae bacterium]
MASDFGDESGQRLLDDFVRFGQQAGIEAMRERAFAVRRACENARDGARGAAGTDGVPGGADPKEWAKLDMHEFQAIEGYERIKEIIGSKLAAHGAEFHWHADGDAGREFLLFKVRDAREVWESFGELAREADVACEKAAAAVQRSVEHEAPGRDGSERDRKDGTGAHEAPEPGAGRQRPRTHRNGDHAKTFAQKHGIPVLRDVGPRDTRSLEERAAHTRAASAALAGA